MNVAEEDEGQIAKRQAIQAIMRDNSLTPQQKQKMTQQLIATGGEKATASSSAPAHSSGLSEGGGDQTQDHRVIPATMPDASSTSQEEQKRVQALIAPDATPAAAVEPPTTAPGPAPVSAPQPVAPTTAKQVLMSAVMRDASLTPQEKQRKIQQIMTGSAAEPSDRVSEPTAAPVPTPAVQPTASSSRQAQMAVVMKDASLTPKQKQQKIQDIMKGGAAADHPALAISELEPASTEPLPAATNSRGSIQEVTEDTSSTPQEKQQKIQRIMDNDPTPAPAPTAAIPLPTEPAAPTRASGVGALASSRVDPAARKGARGSSTISPAAAVMIRSSSNTDSMGVGATSSSDVDSAARKGSRGSSRVQTAGNTPSDTASVVETAAMVPPGLGAVSSRGMDPANRKGVRASARTSSYRSTATSGASVALGDSQSVGAASGSRDDIPADRKAGRANRAALASATSTGLQSRSVESEQNSDVSQGYQETKTSSSPTAAASECYSGTAQASNIRNLETEGISNATVAPAPVGAGEVRGIGNSGEIRGSAGVATEAAPAAALAPTFMDDRANVGNNVPMPILTEEGHNGTSNYMENSGSNMEQPQSYAGLGLTDPEIAGADTGGIQAYVAGEDKEEVVGATEVVTEAAIAEEDKRKQRRILRIGVAMFCMLLIAIIVPVVLTVPGGDEGGIVNITDSPTSAPSAPPTGATFAELLGSIQPLYPSDDIFEKAFSSYDSPQYKAADWTANTAPLGYTGSEPRMISRYALAVFYFSTNGDDWERCGVGSTNCDVEREWLTAENECDWLAISCQDPAGGDHTVLELFFPATGAFGNNVAGTLPVELAMLSGLERIVLSRQALEGSIPETWASLTNLQTLIISRNQLSGEFPHFLFQQNALLGTLYISVNKFSGLLPPISSDSLADLRFDENNITGPIPSEFGALGSLRELYADSNDLTGEIPEELYSLPKLRSLRLSNNTGLTGTLPESIENLQSLQQLRLVNTGLAGPLPAGLFNLIDLQILEMNVNFFSGTLSPDFVRLANVTLIALSNNTFTGAIPDIFKDLQYLRSLELHANDLTGSISEGLCNRTGDGFFDVNFLTADCSGEEPEVACICCDDCF